MSTNSGSQLTAPVALKGQTRLPGYVLSTLLQVPTQQQFSVHDLRWNNIVERKKYFKVAAIPIDCLDGFVVGEGVRAGARVYCRDKGDETAGLLTSKTGECYYGKLKGTQRKNKAGKTLDEACQGDRRSKIAFGDSNKAGCQYAFTVKEYAAREKVAFIKFVSREEERLDETCKSMGHFNKSGFQAHDGRVEHVSYTEAAKDIVLDRLKVGSPVKIVLDGAHCAIQQHETVARCA